MNFKKHIGGFGLKKIEFSPPDISEKEVSYVTEVLRSYWITTGVKTRKLEENLSRYYGTNKTKCMSSATAGLEMVLRVLNIGRGDEVITSPYTYSASCSIICHVGAKPVLVDITDDSFEINYNKLESAINSNTKAIILIDIGGVVCDYDIAYKIILSKKHLFKSSSKIQEMLGRIALIADAAHSLGAKKNGNASGTIADFSVFSFHAVKNLTTAEGGAVTWRKIEGITDDEIYKKFSLFSLHGQNVDAYSKSIIGNWEYDIMLPGFKCNMTDVHAAIGLAQLERFEELLERRKQIVKIYNENLNNLDVKILQNHENINESSHHLYMLNLIGKNLEFRNLLIKKMAECGIAVNVHYKPLPMFTAYKNLGFNIKHYPCSYNKYKNEITLPLHTLMTDDDVYYVIDNFKKILIY